MHYYNCMCSADCVPSVPVLSGAPLFIMVFTASVPSQYYVFLFFPLQEKTLGFVTDRFFTNIEKWVRATYMIIWNQRVESKSHPWYRTVTHHHLLKMSFEWTLFEQYSSSFECKKRAQIICMKVVLATHNPELHIMSLDVLSLMGLNISISHKS